MPINDAKAAWRTRTRDWAVALLGGFCAHCGTTEDLDFDHVDSASKAFAISVGIRDGYSKARLLAELRKCQLLCDPCHREKSNKCGETGGGWNKVLNPEHGTAVRYGKGWDCRCPACKKWKYDYRHHLVDSRGVLVAMV